MILISFQLCFRVFDNEIQKKKKNNFQYKTVKFTHCIKSYKKQHMNIGIHHICIKFIQKLRKIKFQNIFTYHT